MQNEQQFCNSSSHTISCVLTGLVVIAMALTLPVVLSQAAGAQNFQVIYNFDGHGIGPVLPEAGLTIDVAGNFYGTTYGGGAADLGTVFKLTPSGSGWSLAILHSFTGGNDGERLYDRVTIGQAGVLYGTTNNGGGNGCQLGFGCGTLFAMRMAPGPTSPPSGIIPWNENVLYSFTGASDGNGPEGDLIFDQQRNIYGTTPVGGSYRCGVTFEFDAGTQTLAPLGEDSRGCQPRHGVIFDNSGNLYGVYQGGGWFGYGAIYQLPPSGSGWTTQILYDFSGEADGGNPIGGLLLDSSGNIYGTTAGYTGGGGGTVFELSFANGFWVLTTLHSFAGDHTCGPADKLIMDSTGSLYGSTFCDGAFGDGSVFKLTPSNGGWTYQSLHDFSQVDGKNPSALVFDAEGHLYGTTLWGGTHGEGVIFKITQ